MIRTKLQIKKERKELKQEIFDLRHPRDVKGQFVSKYDAPRNLRYWKKKWGRKYGITTPEQGEAVEAMEQGLDQEEAEPKKKSILELLKPETIEYPYIPMGFSTSMQKGYSYLFAILMFGTSLAGCLGTEDIEYTEVEEEPEVEDTESASDNNEDIVEKPEPVVRNWWCSSSGMGGHHVDSAYEGMTKGDLSDEDCQAVNEQFAAAIAWAMQWPTLGEAEDDDFHMVVDYVEEWAPIMPGSGISAWMMISTPKTLNSPGPGWTVSSNMINLNSLCTQEQNQTRPLSVLHGM